MTALAALVFDGECRFCTWSARFIARHATRPIRIVPWQRLAPFEYGLTPSDAASTAWWVTEHGTCFGGHRAMALALSACRRPWRQVGRLLLRPPVAPLAATAWRVVSRGRHLLPGVPASLASSTF